MACKHGSFITLLCEKKKTQFVKNVFACRYMGWDFFDFNHPSGATCQAGECEEQPIDSLSCFRVCQSAKSEKMKCLAAFYYAAI